MEQRRIGGLSVSTVGMGCNQLGTKACDEATGIAVVHEAIEAGITYFDTSDEYGRDYANPADASGWGRSEEILGKALKAHRDKVVIATKFGPFGPLDDPSHADLLAMPRSHASSAGVRIAVEESLQRLGTDHIDLYQLHFPDRRFPIAETLGALDELVKAGKVLEVGCSNFSGAQIREAEATSIAGGISRFVSNQSQLNLFSRQALTDSLPACVETGLAFIPYYPLASGVLTGKYTRGGAVPTGSRLDVQVTEAVRAKMLSDRTFNRLEALTTYAGDHGHTLLELAFGWLLGLPSVATVIAGAARAGQAAANARSAGWVLDAQQIAEVQGVLDSVG